MLEQSMVRTPVLALALLACSGCGVTLEETYEIVPQQIDEAWVFTYSEPPLLQFMALHWGEPEVVDGCLLVDDAVVVWYPEHLDVVRESLDLLEAGEPPFLRFGGGGFSEDEDSTFVLPPAVLEHCAVEAIWLSSEEVPTFEERPEDWR